MDPETGKDGAPSAASVGDRVRIEDAGTVSAAAPAAVSPLRVNSLEDLEELFRRGEEAARDMIGLRAAALSVLEEDEVMTRLSKARRQTVRTALDSAGSFMGTVMAVSKYLGRLEG
jgi:hypothetical protein